MAFRSIYYNFIRDIRANLVSLTHTSLQILDKTQIGGISDFRISGQSFIKENCNNPRSNDDIDMKLKPVTKHDKRNKTTSKNSDDVIISPNCDVIIICLVFGQFWAIQKPDFGHMVYKSYIFINSHLLFYKNWKQN